MATYSTAALVKSRIKKYNTTITDAEIEDYILHAEGLINAIMQGKFTASFDATKHKLIQRATTNLAAFNLLCYDPGSFTSITEASIIGDFLFTMIEQDLKFLADDRIVSYINGL